MFPDDIRPLLVIVIPVIGALAIFVAWVNTRVLPPYDVSTPEDDSRPEA